MFRGGGFGSYTTKYVMSRKQKFRLANDFLVGKIRIKRGTIGVEKPFGPQGQLVLTISCEPWEITIPRYFAEPVETKSK